MDNLNTENIRCSTKFIEEAEKIVLETGRDFIEVLIELLEECSFRKEHNR